MSPGRYLQRRCAGTLNPKPSSGAVLDRCSVSAGIVSAVGRRGSDLGLPGGGDFIQTDAACNSGSSGGPLVNVQGEVIGISNMTAVAADGVSFAIPIDSARAVIDRVQPLTRSSVLCNS